MSLPTVTYAYYTDAYKGGLGHDVFQTALPHAVAAVKDLIGYNVPDGDTQTTAYEMAVCAACDVDAQYGCSGGVMEKLAGASIGSFSYSAPTAESSYNVDMERAIRQQLVGTGLLYRVVY